jgi:hypothetical protein
MIAKFLFDLGSLGGNLTMRSRSRDFAPQLDAPFQTGPFEALRFAPIVAALSPSPHPPSPATSSIADNRQVAVEHRNLPSAPATANPRRF